MRAEEQKAKAEQQKQPVDEATKLEPIEEEDHPSVEKSSLVGSKSGQPPERKRRVTIVDYYTNGAGDLSTTVGEQFCFLAVACSNTKYCCCWTEDVLLLHTYRKEALCFTAMLSFFTGLVVRAY